MSVNAGDLRHRVTIEHYIDGGRDDDGFEQLGRWAVLKKVWSQITYLSSKDLIAAQGAQSQVVARLKLRYNTAKGINTTMRVRYQDQVYAIDSQGMPDNINGKTYVTFNLSQGVEHHV